MGQLGLRTSRLGKQREMRVAIDLMRLGEVFSAICPDSPFDLVLCQGGKMYRVEVTGATPTKNGGLSHPHKKTSDRYDILAAVLLDGSIVYEGLPDA